MRAKSNVLWFLPVLALVACSPARAGERYGKEPDPEAPRVTLAALVAEPEAYEGKDVVVDGMFAGNCGDGDFFFKDKLDIVEADPPAPEVSKIEKGTPIRLFALVKVIRGGDEPGVKLVAKGVEVLE